jgi:hypothetical protein
MHERGVDVVVLHGVEIGRNRAEPTAGQSEALVPGGRSDPLRKGLRVTNSRDMLHQAKKNDLSNVLDVTVVEAVGTADRPDERHEAREQLAPGRLLAAAGRGHQIAHRGRDLSADEQHTIQARYLIAADGGRTFAPALGTVMAGPTNMVDMVSTHFSADLSQYWDDETLITWFLNPEGQDS